MKNKKGFTLIELLAVILILGVIALIAIPTVTKVIKESKKGSFETAVKNVVRAVELECQMEQMRNEDLTTSYNFADGKVDQNLDVKGKLPKSGTIVVDESCKIVVDVSDGEFIAKKELDSDKIVITEENAKASYKAYSVGDEVTLSDGTTWIVVKESTKNENEIKLMSMLNIKNNLTTETGIEMFDSENIYEDFGIAFDDEGNVWENSTLKFYLDNIVKSRLESSLGTTISDITIWGVEELTSLGCTVTGNETDGYSSIVCDNTKTWYSKVFDNEIASWVKLSEGAYAGRAFIAHGNGVIGSDFTFYANRGIRPIIITSKSIIK